EPITWERQLRGRASSQRAAAALVRSLSRQRLETPTQSVDRRARSATGLRSGTGVTPRPVRDNESVCSESVVSQGSCNSRWSRLSRRSASRAVGSAEIEEAKIKAAQEDLKLLRQKNVRTFREAIVAPHVYCTCARSLQVTVPEEFSLSCPITPRGRVVAAEGPAASSGGRVWEGSLRGSSQCSE
ncbi:unnamed protein product, partial [Polarella glacialis]